MVRLALANTLHERLILLDRSRAWVLGVPFSQLAKRTRTTLVRKRPEEEARKIDVYAEIGKKPNLYHRAASSPLRIEDPTTWELRRASQQILPAYDRTRPTQPEPRLRTIKAY